jgi:hypothetical protein
VGPRAGLDAVEKRKISASAKNRTPIPRSCSQYIVIIMTGLLEHFFVLKLMHLSRQCVGILQSTGIFKNC